MGALTGRVVIVTGAGSGIGREYARYLGRQGAWVVVNDFAPGAAAESAAHPAEQVAAEIRAAGGAAIANGADVSDENAVDDLVAATLAEFGAVDGLVNNAGILRDRTLLNMSADDWDAVIRVHLRGTFLPTRAVGRYWRDRAKAGELRAARIVNTSSSSGLLGNIGQANYGAAKAGIAAFTQIVAMELHRYGVTVNAIAPAARTAMTAALMAEPTGDFDPYDPAAVAPLVGYLVSAEAGDVTGRVFNVHGGVLGVYENWVVGPHLDRGRLWRGDEVGAAVADLLSRARGNDRVPGHAPVQKAE